MNEIILMRYFRAVKIPLKAHKNAGGGPIGWPLNDFQLRHGKMENS